MLLSDARFLVVDDHQPMREILKSLLFGLGVRQVQEARDAAMAFEILRHTAFDVLLTDYDMEGATGVQLAARLRRARSNQNRQIAIVMVTGRAEGPVILAARDAGVDEYLIKPLTTLALSQKLDAVLSRRRPWIVSESYVGPDRRRRAAPFPGGERRGLATSAAAEGR